MGLNKTISVCHIISGDLWAGPEVQEYTQLKALRKRSDLVFQAIVLNRGKLSDALSSLDIDVTIIDEQRYSFREIVRCAREALRGQVVDVLHSHRYKENLLAARLKNFGLARHLVQTVHGLGEPFSGWDGVKVRLYDRINRRITRKQFDRVIAVSRDIQQQLTNVYGQNCLTTVHNVIDPKAIAPSRSNDLVRQELGLSSEVGIIAAVGRLVPIKRFDLFIRMARLVVDKIPSTRYLIVGDGPLKADLEQQVHSAELKDAILFTGFRDDIWDVLGAIDLFVITSDHEGIPVTLLEAMALRRAVVSTGVGGISEVVEDGLSGRLVEKGDVSGLARACIELLDSPSERARLGIAARQRVETCFSAESAAEKLHALYQELSGCQ